MKIIFKTWALLLALALSSCGGGGGFSGTPSGPSAKLRVFPPVTAVNLAVGDSGNANLEIQGGRPPYVVKSSNFSVDAGIVDGNKLWLSGKSEGSSEISIFDQERETVKITAEAVKIPMKSTIGTSISISPKQSKRFEISGGRGSYRLRSSDARIVTVSPDSGTSYGPFSMTGVAAGTATVVATDSVGTEFTINVTVTALTITVTPATGTGKVKTEITLNLSDGLAPFTVQSTDKSIAEGSISGNLLTVTLKKAGTTTLTVQDAQGASQSVTITVTASTLTIRPAQMAVSSMDLVKFAIIGEAPPYTAVVPDKSFVRSAIISDDNKELLVTPIQPSEANATGTPANCYTTATAKISVYDKEGVSAEATLLISKAPVCATAPATAASR